MLLILFLFLLAFFLMPFRAQRRTCFLSFFVRATNPLSAALITFIALSSTTAHAQQAPDDLRLFFTGDIMMSRLVNLEMEQRRKSPWADFSALFHSADLVGGNFESAIGSQAACPKEDKLCFAAPESSVQWIRDAGFHLVTAENNHSGDLGTSGRDATRAAFQKDGLPALDFNHSPQFFRLKNVTQNVTVGIVAITMVRAADGRVQEIPSVALAQKLRLARQLANLVIVSIHWGNELQDWPTEAQQQQARWLVEHGADLIVGHHPHVVQRPQCIEGRPVFFSLGNHLFDQKYAETKTGLIADCHIHDGKLSCGGLSTHTGVATSYPALRGRDQAADQALQGCTVQLGPDFEVAGITIKPEPWSQDQPADGIVLEGYRDGHLEWQSRRQHVVSLQATKAMGPDPLLLSLERHRSSIDEESGLRPYVYAMSPHGLIARWRGSALAWPLSDAVALDNGVLCALHRGDSFLLSDPTTKETRIAAYRWNGFGFNGIDTPAECSQAFQ
jgi:hypothetical protein